VTNWFPLEKPRL
jgi:hypothetical protein